MPQQSKAVAFDLDTASLTSLREALPEWEVEVVNGATVASLGRDWDPGAADLLVVNARKEASESIRLCRFLAFGGGFANDSRGAATPERGKDQQDQARRAGAPLLALVPPGQEALVRAALEAGAQGCLVLPIHAQDVNRMLSHALAGNQPGRHTLNLERAQVEDRWRDDGGQG